MTVLTGGQNEKRGRTAAAVRNSELPEVIIADGLEMAKEKK